LTKRRTDKHKKKPWREPPRQYPSLLYGFLIRSRRRGNVSIATMIDDIIIYISVKQLTSTDQYWRSYGPASFDFKTRHRYIELRRTITRWISVRCRRFLRRNKDFFIAFILMYRMESTRRYWRRYGSAGFGMRNRPCLHIKHNNFLETWHFLIILLFYDRVCIYLTASKLLYRKTKRKGFIFPPSHGIPPKWQKKWWSEMNVVCAVFFKFF